jgi:WhiB family transcriptional regulator, redox-sensing transcriptional regulator
MSAAAVLSDGQRHRVGRGGWPEPGSPRAATEWPCAEPDLWVWMDHAACRGAGPAEFFGEPAARARGQARCRGCPVREVCLWWALAVEADAGYRFGIWGGLSPAVRARIARVTGAAYARARFVAAAASWTSRPPAGVHDAAVVA